MITKIQKQAVLSLNSKREYPLAEEKALALAETVRKAVSEKDHRIYARVVRVAKSGMSRTIDLAVIHNGEFQSINWFFGPVYGDRKNTEQDGSVYMSGCGMDMLFEATYRLYQFFYPYKPGKGQSRPYEKCLNRYTTF